MEDHAGVGRESPAGKTGADSYFQILFENIQAILLIIDPDSYQITDANRTALKFSGISESEVIGRLFWDTPWWTYSEKLQQELQEGIRSAKLGNFVRFESTYKTADGSLHHIDFSIRPVYDKAGQVMYLLAEGRDITDQKKIEGELQQKNSDLAAAYEQLTATDGELRQDYNDLVNTDKELVDRENKIRAMFEQTFQFIDLLTTDGILVNTNRPLSAFGAASISDLAKIPYPDTKLWSYSRNLSRKMKYAVLSAARGEFTRFEILDTSDDGSPRYTDFSIKPVKDRNGKAHYLIAECRDITDLKTTSQALVESENLYRAIFGNTGTAMALLEEDTTISLVNVEFEHLCGFSKSEIEGHMSWTRFIDADDLKRMEEEFAARKTGDSPATPTQSEFRFITKAGEVRDIFLTMDNIPETRKSVASLMDITERNQMTQKLSAALQEKEVLLREIHHRVKNNLQIIISLLNLQSRSFSDENVLGAIMESQNRVRAMALVHEKIYQSENLSEIDITEYIRYLGTYLFQFYNVNMNTIRLKIEGEHIRLGINTAVPLGLIINELISNSLKHAFPGGRAGEILVRLEATDSDIEILVSDNGIGFKKDYDWEKSETLGLMLVQNLIRQILATVQVDGAAGTQYRIKIPLKKMEAGHL